MLVNNTRSLEAPADLEIGSYRNHREFFSSVIGNIYDDSLMTVATSSKKSSKRLPSEEK